MAVPSSVMVRGVRSMVMVMVLAFMVLFLCVGRQSRQLHERAVPIKSQAICSIFSINTLI
jgi:hypothetical protein